MKKNKKILIVSHLYPSESQPVKGIFVHKMNLALKKSGFDIYVISPQVFGKNKTKKNGILDGIKIVYPRYLSFSRCLIGVSSWFAYRSAKKVIIENDFDLILAHTAIPDGYVAKKLSGKFNISYFVYIHGADVQHKINYSAKANDLITDVLKNAKNVFVNSSKTENLVKKLGVNSAIVPLGVDEARQSNKNKTSKKVRIISVCNLEVEKGIQYVIEALRGIQEKNLEYIIIGDGNYRNEIEKKVNNDSRVQFLGCLPQAQVFKELAKSDIFVLPSYNEAFGVAYLEAMVTGLPIIGVKGEGVEDILSKGECGVLVEPKSAESVKSALTNLINNASLREKMGATGKKVVREHYLWKETAKKLAEEFSK